MLIKNNYQYESVTETPSKPVVAFRAVLELLSECAHKCKGCFVNKENIYSKTDLVILHDIIRKINSKGMLVDEVVIGPVDFFGAANTEQLMTNPLFYKIFFDYKPIFATPTTLKQQPWIIEKKLKLFENFPDNMEVEFLIVFDIKKLAEQDPIYIAELHHKISLLDRIKQPTCYAFQINAQNIDKYDLGEISRFVRDEFDTIIDIVPSFFRSQNPKAIKGMLKLWNRTINEQVTEENKNDIQMVIADASHAGFNYTNLVYSRGLFYLAPFLHEIVADTSLYNLINPSQGCFYSDLDITKKVNQARVDGFKYAEQTTECMDCSNLSSCTSKFVLHFMEHYDIKDCVLPKKALELFNGDMGEQVNQVYNWDNYSVEDEMENGTNYGDMDVKK